MAVENNQHSLSHISLELHVYHKQHDTIQEQCFTLSEGGEGGEGEEEEEEEKEKEEEEEKEEEVKEKEE